MSVMYREGPQVSRCPGDSVSGDLIKAGDTLRVPRLLRGLTGCLLLGWLARSLPGWLTRGLAVWLDNWLIG